MPQKIHHKTFENGLVLLGEQNCSLESVAFSFLTPSGCSVETTDRAGLAAITCDMMLRGAGSRNNRQFINDLENLGVERDESVGVTQASYGGATIKENLSTALEIYADLFRSPHLPAEHLEAARLVCQQELHAVEDEPAQKLMQRLRRWCYPDPYGRSSQGTREGLQAITHNEVVAFHTANYRPNGTILAVAGNFDWERLCALVESLFGGWKQQPAFKIETKPSDKQPSHYDFESGQAHIGIAFPTVPYRDPDYFQAWAAVGVLGSGMSSRLFTEVREKRGLCYAVYASLHTQRERANVLCYAGTTNERAQETLDVTCGELLRLADGIEADELKRLKARIKSSLIMQQESSSSRSGSIARDWYHLGKVRTLEEVGTMVDQLTANSINDYLTAHPPKDFKVLTLGKNALEVPHGIS